MTTARSQSVAPLPLRPEAVAALAALDAPVGAWPVTGCRALRYVYFAAGPSDDQRVQIMAPVVLLWLLKIGRQVGPVSERTWEFYLFVRIVLAMSAGSPAEVVLFAVGV